jgi:hypothetical protein
LVDSQSVTAATRAVRASVSSRRSARRHSTTVGHPLEAPVPHHAGMQEVLVDRGELVLQQLVELGDDLWIALHGSLLGYAFA